MRLGERRGIGMICSPCELGESVGCVWASAGVWIRPFVVETFAGGFLYTFTGTIPGID